MRIGVIGAGMIGGTLGELWAKAGHEVMLSSRHPESLRERVSHQRPAPRVGTPEEAAAFGELVLLAIPFGATPNLPDAVKRSLSGKVVLDAGNPYPQRDGAAAAEAQREGRGSGYWTARHLPGARVVKAFNTVYFKTLAAQAHQGTDRVGIPLASDDAQALQTAAQAVREAGFEPVPLGALERARDFDVGTPVYNTGMTGSALRRHFGLG
jgi:predicted dinucleotide-binding enzyme